VAAANASEGDRDGYRHAEQGEGRVALSPPARLFDQRLLLTQPFESRGVAETLTAADEQHRESAHPSPSLLRRGYRPAIGHAPSNIAYQRAKPATGG
jgi:hypothetical protein